MALSNNDFRQLLNEADASVLATTREQKKKLQSQQQRTPGQISAAQQRRRERYIEILKRKQQKGQKDAEGGKGGGGYRDRADERRKQKEAFYAHVAEELAELKERSVEESKFLGGDVEHTHLVKGLDLALLAKVRGELNKEQQRKPKTEEPLQEKARGKTTLQIHDPRIRRAFYFLFDNLHPHAARFRDRLANLEMRIMTGLSLSASSARDSFGNGCLSYTFPLGPGAAAAGFMPTLVRRSALLREEEGGGGESENPRASAAPVQAKVVKEMAEALAWHRENRKKKKEDRLPRRPTGREAVAAGVGTGGGEQGDGDIFGGVGGFDAADVLAKAQAEAASFKPRGGDAKTADWIHEEGEMELEDEQPASTTPLDSRADKQLATSRALTESLAEDDDTYAECYPCTFFSELTVLQLPWGQLLAVADGDSEDEDASVALQKMDPGEYRDVLNQKKGGKKAPQQFSSKAEYEEYMSSIEYVPKAAFSYGRRIAGEEFNPTKGTGTLKGEAVGYLFVTARNAEGKEGAQVVGHRVLNIHALRAAALH
ncbi:hypothetical protein Efla_001042 [Eimeria flavescens]